MLFREVLAGYNEGHHGAPVKAERSENGDLVVTISGELEMKASSDIAPLLGSALLECTGRGRLLVDLGGVSYISSTGVGLLSTTMIDAEKLSITFVLINLPHKVKNIMDALGLLSFFNVEGEGPSG